MPAGKRRKILHERLERDLLPVFAGRILPLDLDASRAYAELTSKAKIVGLTINMADAYIAAIAAARGLSVASRDVAPFQSQGLYGGATVSGSSLSNDVNAQQNYYGSALTAWQIVVGLQGSNAGANPLRSTLAHYGGS